MTWSKAECIERLKTMGSHYSPVYPDEAAAIISCLESLAEPTLGEAVSVLKKSSVYIVELDDGSRCVGITDAEKHFYWPDLSEFNGLGFTGVANGASRIRRFYQFNPAWLPVLPPAKTEGEKLAAEIDSAVDGWFGHDFTPTRAEIKAAIKSIPAIEKLLESE